MLLLGAILLAIFVLPSPWGLIAVVCGGLIDVGESLVLLRWTRRKRSVVGAQALVGRPAVVVTQTQVKVDGELWRFRSDAPLEPGAEVEVAAVDGLTLEVSRRSRAQH